MSLRYALLWGFSAAAVLVLFVGGVGLFTVYQLGQATTPGAGETAMLVRRAVWIMGGLTAVGLLSVGGVAWWTAARLSEPLYALRDALKRLRDEGGDAALPTDGPREVAQVAQRVNDLMGMMKRETVPRSYLNNLLDSMGEMLFALDEDGHIRRINRAAADVVGPPSTMQGRAFQTLLVEGTLPPVADGHPQGEGKIRAQDGTAVPVLYSLSVVKNPTGDAQGLVCVAQDISDLKEAEQELRASLEEKEVLLREIHHRVKNNLQVISSLLHLQSRKVDDATARQLFTDSQSRIRSMALIHEQLYQSEDLAQLNVEGYLQQLTDHLFRTYNMRGSSVTLAIEADDASLAMDQAIPCGLIVNELVSNALEHAFPGDRSGTVRVALTRTNGAARLVVEDDGVGAPDPAAIETSDTLGLKLVRGLVQQLGGDLTVTVPAGLRFTITFPHD